MPKTDEINAMSLPALFRHLAAGGLVRRLLEIARDEDLGVGPLDAAGRGGAPTGGSGDATSDCCIGPERMGVGLVVARSGGVMAGLDALPMLLELFAPSCKGEVHVRDGERAEPGATVATVRGALDEVLALERTLLNLVGRLSGIATRTAEFVAAIPAGSRAGLYDTRKTTPGLRVLEKYAVRCGGGRSHRMGLHDAVLIKDNHLAGVGVGELAAFVALAAAKARGAGSLLFVEVEVDTLEQFGALLTLPEGVVDIVLLDNMSCAQMSEAAARRDRTNPALELEASGGVTLASLPGIAATGVDRISVGGLTHSAVSLDVAMDVAADEPR